MSDCDIETKMSTDLSELAQWVKVLCEPNRLMLIDTIMSGIQCNCEIGKAVGLAPNLISHHLSILRDSGIIDANRDENDGRWIYYSINKGVMDRLQVLFSKFFDSSRVKPLSLYCGPKQKCDDKTEPC